MENPATWTDAEWEIHRVLTEHADEVPEIVGLSLERKIADALRRRKLLPPAPWEKRNWEKDRG